MRVLIYTAITGGKDDLCRPEITPGADYLCFTDQPKRCEGSGWDVRRIDNPLGNTPDGFCRSAKRMKILPHRWLPKGYDYSVWVDGARCPKADLTPLIVSAGKFGLFSHPRPERTLFAEANACRNTPKDDPKKIDAQMARYGRPDLPVLAGYVLFRDHNDHAVIDFMERWWAEIDAGSRRDQLSLPWVIKQTGLRPTVFSHDEYLKHIGRHGHSW